MQRLVLSIHLHDDRYHGAGEWPPAPARVFQALVAGVARANRFPDNVAGAFRWLESLPAPVIATPPSRVGQRVTMFVPNNDADTLGGDLARVSEIRTKKTVQPRLLESHSRFLYAWPLEGSPAEATTIAGVADQLYQLGRGLDMAFCVADIVDDTELEETLATHRGPIHRPSFGGDNELSLACPRAGSFASLVRRYSEAAERLRPSDGGELFFQPPKPQFAQVSYDARAWRQAYELRRVRADDTERDDEEGAFFSWSLTRALDLVQRIRDGAAARLRAAIPDLTPAIDRTIIGRKPNGDDAGPIEWRLRIVPLPSIGHPHADHAIRRVLIDLPPGGPLSAADVHWALSGMRTIDPSTGEVDPFVLVPSPTDTMTERYGTRARRWRTVTAAALPDSSKRRRIDPVRKHEEAKGSRERTAEESCAAVSVAAALRHAGVEAHIVSLRAQREPLTGKGARAEKFADGRFAKERLWHLEIELDRAVDGPLAIGDGRFLGLGVLEPVVMAETFLALRICEGLAHPVDVVALARSFRRAVLACAQRSLGERRLPSFFTGHGPDGEPARGENEPHVAFHFDAPDRLLVFAPHEVRRRAPWRKEQQYIATLERVMQEMSVLRAGRAGLLRLAPALLRRESDPLFTMSQTWVSRSPYTVNRHLKKRTASEAIVADIVAECRRRRLPVPSVRVHATRGAARRGLEGEVTLTFPVAIAGPLMLGRSRHLGGGLFAATTVTT
jgi:CRISPR-associated protein Csb2